MPNVSELDFFRPDPSDKNQPPIPFLTAWPEDYRPAQDYVFNRRGVALLIKRLHDLTFQNIRPKLLLTNSKAKNYLDNKSQFEKLQLLKAAPGGSTLPQGMPNFQPDVTAAASLAHITSRDVAVLVSCSLSCNFPLFP
jgi:hypothetical protein